MNCVKEEEVGIKMAVSNFVPTINEAAATYKGISAVKEISLQLWLSTVRKKLVQKHFFKVGELSGNSDWGQESSICFLKSVKSQRILSSDIFVFSHCMLLENSRHLLKESGVLWCLNFIAKDKDTVVSTEIRLFGYIQKGVLIGIQLFQNGVSCSGTETTITMGYKKRTKYALK